MNPLTQFKKIPILPLVIIVALAIGPAFAAHAADFTATPVIVWSNEARRAIVPAGPGGIFGAENYGNKFPGEAAVYLGIVHAAMYDAAVAIEAGYEAYAIALTAPPNTSSAAAIATAAHDTLVGCPDCGHSGLQPALGLTPAQQAILDGDYANYLAAIPDGTAKTNGIAIGKQVAAAVVALRTNDGREKNPTLADLNPPPPGPGVWEPNPGNPAPPVLGLRLPGITPLALTSASQFRPDGPNALTSEEYADDFNQVKSVGRVDSTARTPAQTTQALFWTDHDLRQWNDGMLRLAVDHGLDLVQTARMLAMAHVSGGDGMIACFEAKYHYWFIRPPQADAGIHTVFPTPQHPSYPSAHSCFSGAFSAVLADAFPSERARMDAMAQEASLSRLYAGIHYRFDMEAGLALGRGVAALALAADLDQVAPGTRSRAPRHRHHSLDRDR